MDELYNKVLNGYCYICGAELEVQVDDDNELVLFCNTCNTLYICNKKTNKLSIEVVE